MKNITSLISLTILGSLLSACGSTGKTEEKISDEQAPSYHCYGSYTDRDSVFLKLNFMGDEVSGDLIYKLYEKDKNQGTLTGVMHGDTLLAIYRFTSEGKTSIRDVAFLKQGNDLIEGFAPLDEEGVHFENKNDIDFAGIVLQSGECKE